MRYTASVVGGGMGGRLSLGALAASDRFDLLAAADLRPDVRDALARDFPGLRVFATHRDMFRACPTDVTCVSTYPPSHEEVALDALEMLPLRGLLVEKPLGHTVSSGRRICDAVRRRGLPMAVPHGMVAKRTPLEVIERVRRGDIGDLKLVEIQCTGWDIINAGIHWFHFFVMLTGSEPMASVMALCDASTRTYRDGMQVETVAVTYGRTSSGIRVVLHSGDRVPTTPGPGATGSDFVFRIVGTQGQIECWGWADGYRILNASNPGGEFVLPAEMAVTGHRRHLEDMAAMMDRGVPDYTVAEGSLTALQICEGAYVSSRHRCEVTFPVDAFVPPTASDWDPGKPYSGESGGRDGRHL